MSTGKLPCGRTGCSYGKENGYNCDLWSDCDLFMALSKTKKPPQNKYGAEKVKIGDITFDSSKEARRYYELKIIERTGTISNIERQKKFVLIPEQVDKDGKCIEREVSYFADFCYIENESGKTIVEDVKGYRQGQAYALFTIKRKLMLWVHGIKVEEI